MKILSIGNSYSQDATHYLHQIAKADGAEIKTVNLYIGGCSLSTHYKNMNNDDRAYAFEFNGQYTGIKVSIREALQSDEWDYVTMQQASLQSIDFETFQPYLNALSDYVRLHAPKAKQLIHQTWAYEETCERLHNQLGYAHQADMFADVKAAYECAYNAIGANGILPSGQTVEILSALGAGPIYRDPISHMSLGLGRYATGLSWYALLSGANIAKNSFCEFDEAMSDESIAFAKKAAAAAADEYRRFLR